MYNFKKYKPKSFGFWDIQNKFIKKKSNKFISNQNKTLDKTLNQNKTLDKTLNQNKTLNKTLNQNKTLNKTLNQNKTLDKTLNQNKTLDKTLKSKVDFSEIDILMKQSKQFLPTSFVSFKNISSFNNEQTLDELLNESLLLIICTELIYSTKRFDKNLYQRIFGDKWRDIQSLL